VKRYLVEKVVNRTEDVDNSLKKFFKSVLQAFSEEHSEVFGGSGLAEILHQLNQ